jgi:hypothetical protein
MCLGRSRRLRCACVCIKDDQPARDNQRVTVAHAVEDTRVRECSVRTAPHMTSDVAPSGTHPGTYSPENPVSWHSRRLLPLGLNGAYGDRTRDTMLADLDLLLIAVFCTADDLLPQPAKNARRMLTDAEVVTLCVAQAIMGISSDARFLKAARRQLAHLFPLLPNRPGYLKRRQRLSDTIEWLMTVFASDSLGFHDDLVLVDSTPIECPRSVETTRHRGRPTASARGG